MASKESFRVKMFEMFSLFIIKQQQDDDDDDDEECSLKMHSLPFMTKLSLCASS